MSFDPIQLAKQIKSWGLELGFQEIRICEPDLTEYEAAFNAWLTANYHGEMAWMAHHGVKRTQPKILLPGTQSIIIGRMNYLPPADDCMKILNDPNKAYVARYALGRDYHKLMRKRLTQLAKKILAETGSLSYRAFVDSAPVLEKPLAEKAGLGWIGKNTLLLNRKAGSWFFLGTLFTNIELPHDPPETSHCGTCTACIDICPTQAIVGPYQLDARRCISYLTIEHPGSIPEEFRPLIGNRIYGCDDCQLVCPWNKFANFTEENGFHPRQHIDHQTLIAVFRWTKTEFLNKTEGSAIRRIGYERWLRNIAIALGNASTTSEIIDALQTRQSDPSALVREHVDWALKQHVNL